jgi:hypothetical protein
VKQFGAQHEPSAYLGTITGLARSGFLFSVPADAGCPEFPICLKYLFFDLNNSEIDFSQHGRTIFVPIDEIRTRSKNCRSLSAPKNWSGEPYSLEQQRWR